MTIARGWPAPRTGGGLRPSLSLTVPAAGWVGSGHPGVTPASGFHHLRDTTDELLNDDLFDIVDDARRKLAFWRYDYNSVSPHSSRGTQTLAQAKTEKSQNPHLLL